MTTDIIGYYLLVTLTALVALGFGYLVASALVAAFMD